MKFSEQDYIELCKNDIEEKFSFGNGEGYTQRDLELLSTTIEEKTGVNISLSTLKRLWKNNYKQSPQLATLNAIAAVLDYKDWQEFKLLKRQNNRKKKKFSPLMIGIVMGVLLVIGLFSFLSLSENNRVRINGPIIFKASKTVTRGIPNTVIFNYDVSNVEADSFFLQQSWNPADKVYIDPSAKVFSRIYYESGYHRAKLMANNSVLSKQPIHILSNGWEPHVYYTENKFVDLQSEDIIANGVLQIPKDILVKQNIDTLKYFETRITNSREFNTSTDNFTIRTRVKLDKVIDGHCPWISLLIVAEKHIFIVKLVKKGCERYAVYKMGELYRSGHDNDLSALGCNVYEWQEIGVKVQNKNANIYLNGKLIFKDTYKEDYGDIKALTYVFEGTGSVDYVTLSNANDDTVFDDNFD